ncbi:LAO/AO transport system kinase [Dyadobacter sp. BE34]|uniref:LAO/AO transport system kinase n=1 Tax=Dyadobacter fermentans TaxID=94254 RepID=A0ABU1R8Z3_9BACT|nr:MULTISPECIES: methylmalonyl Co-A mutase-associated GTPase MeaB [Dyadobacter]MDR6809390.1 LAO/AO transport system kinase [Dyadobacter fermentans]MDR7047016.1 LAO/AO transport system kinase [Dyadobacter sp. BE242]MDR7195017.1 LAO/AO transport system kinase [Dyadobacter sp. BE34]MDR7214438.1 LAO/AO transport system kinase [Dyadobacter sp. BE31]MDR7266939.1 LAO/AO transport system kinase [Dyadobacter sp. BE32]
MRQRLSVETYVKGVLSGDRTTLSRAITIIESSLPGDRLLASQILQSILPHTGKSIRIGITGVPGVGKSTFIEAFGSYLTSLGKRVAVLAVDPSSKQSGGSILGDKTRMEKLSRDPHAYIRPSPTNLSLGGVARHTREAILLCEAAGYDIILVETVGVGQSETLVKGMTDFFLLLMLAGAGDELQGIKKGIMEMVDVVAVNKADHGNEQAVAKAVMEYRQALHLFPETASKVPVQVVACSALEGTGMQPIWKLISDYYVQTSESGFLQHNRQFQREDWLREQIRQSLEDRFYENELVKKHITSADQAVRSGEKLPDEAAADLINLFLSSEQASKFSAKS